MFLVGFDEINYQSSRLSSAFFIDVSSDSNTEWILMVLNRSAHLALIPFYTTFLDRGAFKLIIIWTASEKKVFRSWLRLLSILDNDISATLGLCLVLLTFCWIVFSYHFTHDRHKCSVKSAFCKTHLFEEKKTNRKSLLSRQQHNNYKTFRKKGKITVSSVCFRHASISLQLERRWSKHRFHMHWFFFRLHFIHVHTS